MDQKDKVGQLKWPHTTPVRDLRVCKESRIITFSCVSKQFGVAPIHLAAWFGSLNILKLLVQAGAEQKVENEVRMQEIIRIMKHKLGHLSSWAAIQKLLI